MQQVQSEYTSMPQLTPETLRQRQVSDRGIERTPVVY